MTPTHDIQEFAANMVPEGTLGAVGLRALLVEGIQRWESRDPDYAGRTQTFLPTQDADLDQINSAHALEGFRVAYGLRPDWHEPDNNGVTAYVIGDHLDNAMGSTVDHGHGELQIVLAKEVEGTSGSFDRSTFQPVAVVNVASLLSWATSGAYIAKALSEATAQR